MKNACLLIFTVLLGIAPSMSSAQEFCGTMEHFDMRKAADPTLEGKMLAQEDAIQKWIQANPTQKKAGTVVTIPVVVHVVYNTVDQKRLTY